MTANVNSVDFAHAAKRLGASARAAGLVTPTFRSPPRVPNVDRTMRRGRNGWTTVSVRLQGRPLGAVVADMIEGIIVTNRIEGGEATRVRTMLWESLAGPEIRRMHAA